MQPESVKDLIFQAKIDGQDNIIPIIEHFGKSPKQLKLEAGKGAWKEICSNSKIRNISISRLLANFSIVSIEGIQELRDLKYSDINDINTCFYSLKQCYELLSDSFSFCEYKSIVTVFNLTKAELSCILIRDTLTMLLANGEKFNIDWSPTRVQKEHDRLSRLNHVKSLGVDIDFEIPESSKFQSRFESELLYAQQMGGGLLSCMRYDNDGLLYVPDFYRYYDNISVSSSGDYKKRSNLDLFYRHSLRIKFLKTPNDYLNESKEMMHCVSSYCSKALQGNYMTMHIELLSNDRDDMRAFDFRPISDGEFKNQSVTVGCRLDDSNRRLHKEVINPYRFVGSEECRDSSYGTYMPYKVEQVYAQQNTNGSRVLLKMIKSVFDELEFVSMNDVDSYGLQAFHYAAADVTNYYRVAHEERHN